MDYVGTFIARLHCKAIAYFLLQDVIMFKKALLVSALSLGFSGFAQAELVQGDWLTDGDGLSTLDTRTGKEWLNLSQTVGMSLSEVTAALEGELSGWELAGVDDVMELAYSQFEIAGISNLFWSDSRIEAMRAESGNSALPLIEQDRASAESFSDALGGEATADYSNFALYGTYAMYINDYKNTPGFFYSQYSTVRNSGMSLTTLSNVTFYSTGNDNVGWLLVNDAGVSLNSDDGESTASDVSAPLSLGAFAFAAIGFAGLRRKPKV